MIKLIDRVIAYKNNKLVCYCYIISLKLVNKVGKYTTVYALGYSKDHPNSIMLDIAQSYCQVYKYLPECRVIRAVKTTFAPNLVDTITVDLKVVTYPIVFEQSHNTYLKVLDEFDQIVGSVDIDEYILNEWLPNWAYHKDELQDIKDKAITFNDLYYIL